MGTYDVWLSSAAKEADLYALSVLAKIVIKHIPHLIKFSVKMLSFTQTQKSFKKLLRFSSLQLLAFPSSYSSFVSYTNAHLWENRFNLKKKHEQE